MEDDLWVEEVEPGWQVEGVEQEWEDQVEAVPVAAEEAVVVELTIASFLCPLY